MGSGSSSKDTPTDLSATRRRRQKSSGQFHHALREAEDASGLYEGDEIGGVQEFSPGILTRQRKMSRLVTSIFKRKN